MGNREAKNGRSVERENGMGDYSTWNIKLIFNDDSRYAIFYSANIIKSRKKGHFVCRQLCAKMSKENVLFKERNLIGLIRYQRLVTCVSSSLRAMCFSVQLKELNN